MKLKIWLGISEIAGNFCRLKRGFEELGHQVEFIDASQHTFNYGGAKPIPPELLNIFELEKNRFSTKQSIKAIKKNKLNLLRPSFWKYQIQYLRETCYNIYKFISYFKDYDCLIFHYGNSFYLKSQFVFFNDLFWLKLFRIKVIFMMVGSDSRPSFLDFALLNALDDNSIDNIIKTTLETKSNNQFIEKYATHIVSNVFSSYFFNKPIISLQCIGHASIQTSSNHFEHQHTNKINILHAPSRKDAKGTSEIIKIIDKLIAEGENIHLTIISGATNQEVLNEIQKCDFVIDQLYSDFPLAAFTGEASCYKKPTIVGSYVTEQEFVKAYSVLGMPPVLLCHPDTLKSAVLRLTHDHSFRKKLGEAAYNYVSTVTGPTHVAQRYVQSIKGNYPKSWSVNPQQFIKNLPVGMTQEKMISIMQSINNADLINCLELNSKKNVFRHLLSLMKYKKQQVSF